MNVEELLRTATESKLKRMKNMNKRNSETEISLNEGLLYIKVDGEESIDLTPQEAVKKFGDNYYIMQNLRYLLDNEQIEDTIKEEHSVKSEVIDVFIQTLEQNNIFEGKISLEEVRKRLQKNINSAYITKDGYREGLRWILG